MAKQPIPPCPKCRSKAQVSVVGVCGDQFICTRRGCGLFDNDPNEGGDYHETNPAARLERADRRAGRDPLRRR